MTSTRRNWPELLMGLGIIFMGLVIGYEAGTIKIGPLYAKVGPAAFLWFVSVLLIICGGVVAYKAEAATQISKSETGPLLIILAGLAAAVYIMEPLGFIPTAVIIFTVTAHGLGSRKILRDALIGLGLAAIAYIVFAKGLGLRLPVGYFFT